MLPPLVTGVHHEGEDGPGRQHGGEQQQAVDQRGAEAGAALGQDVLSIEAELGP